MSFPTDVAVDIRRAGPADEPAILRLLQRALAGGPTGQREAAFFRWKHQENPFGPSLAWVAEVDGDLAGFRTFMRWRFRTGYGAVRAVRAVDTATDPAHQGRGIFTRLTRHALGELEGEADLVFNTPNEKSLPGYLKMGWKEVARVPIAVRPVRPVRFLANAVRVRRGGGPGAPPPCPFPAVADVMADGRAVDELLDRGHRHDSRLATDRSAAMLAWRYARVPGLDYRAVAVWEGSSLLGLAIGRPRMRGQLAEFTLAELLVGDGDRRTARRLLRTVTHFGGDHVATHLAAGTEAATQARAAGYLSPPWSGMTLVARPLTSLDPDPLEAGSWKLALGDLEVF